MEGRVLCYTVRTQQEDFALPEGQIQKNLEKLAMPPKADQ